MAKKNRPTDEEAQGTGPEDLPPDQPEPEIGETEDTEDGEPSEPTPVAPPLTGAERLALAEAKIEQLLKAMHSLASNTFANAEARAQWLKDHFE